MKTGEVVDGRFEIDRLEASSASSALYRAHDRARGGTVALKVVLRRDADPERFDHEARVLVDLSHPAIVRYIAHGRTARGKPYLAMEWLDGEDLHVRLERGPLSVRDATALVGRAAEGLAAAHARGIVHGDIKPSNLLLLDGRLEQLKILDFGLAKVAPGVVVSAVRPAGIASGTGTPEYMAPEQARGDASIDARADVFSLGCVLYECLTGRPAFSGEHVMAVLAKILLEDAPRLHALAPDVPVMLDDLVARMLSKDREARPQSGGAVAAELRTIGAPGQPTPQSAQAAALTSGEQRLLCVLLAGDVDADAPVGAGVPSALRTASEAFGGQLEPLAGDAFVVTLAGGGSATDQAARAARCALALRRAAPAMPIALAMGRGEVRGTGPMGEVIDRAAGLLRRGERRDASVRIDEVTAGLLDARFDVGGDAAGLDLRGEREIAGASRTLLGKPTAMVGRDQEVSTLLAILDDAAGEPGARAVLVTGAAGVGKTRLRYELTRQVRERPRPVEIWTGRGDAMSRGSPFGMIAESVRRAAGIRDGEPAGVRQQKLRARVARHVPADQRARISEFLAELVGAPLAGDASTELRAARQDPILMGDQLRRAWVDFIASECAAQPVLLVLDDLHWGDLPSVKFVDSALRALRGAPLMVLAIGRPEVHEIFPSLWAARGVHEIRLGPLSRKGAEKLVHQVLGESVSPTTLARIVDQAAGNAFYLEELVRAVADGSGDRLPATVLAMVQARLEALEAEARRVLRAASVFGSSFWSGGVRVLLGGKTRASQLDEWLAELHRRELVVRRGEGRAPLEREYTFRSALVRETAYAMLTDADRTLGHRLAGGWLESVGELDARVLAEHFERGEEPARAVGWYRRAAAQELEGNDLDATLALCARGVGCGASGEALGALHLLSAEALRWRGQSAEAEACAKEAMRLLPRGSPPWYAAAGHVANARGLLGAYDELETLAHELLAMEPSNDGVSPQVIALAHAAGRLLFGGRYGSADSLLSWIQYVQTIQSQFYAADPAAMAWTLRALAVRASIAGDPGGRMVLWAEAAQSFELAGDLRNACMQRTNLGESYAYVGAWRDAETTLREALASAERMGVQTLVATAKQQLGVVLAHLSALDEARAMEMESIELLRAGSRRMLGMSRVRLAQILLLAGDLEGAEREARAAADLLTVAPPARPHALATLARVRIAMDAAPRALDVAREAMALLDSLGQVDEGESLVRLVHAEALHAAGHEGAARDAIAAARARLLSRADQIADGSWRSSFLAHVPENARTLALAEAWLGPQDQPPASAR